ncbi:MAG: SnoaL-like domain-containing protein [Oscillatoriales cyanobacterium RU_3_3]|nr:SnoaL-like domain-containing protein [Microcoleus sp. SU_5_6]NJL66628.1 SnoaL-like domain-containing protein [Microcoleus sp. SM1_3_4]NJM60269.1 SnoaL-like domain-containing protein [Oscillatoriales cyanobacterium RU_3_3]NJR25180.1 SnoaL-like domain-containing protein [Richelia sp. CSU_2_1]
MKTATTTTQDEAQIRQLIAAQESAICAKDLDRIMAPYLSDAIIFDAIPPFQTKGVDALRHTWEECFPCFPDSFKIETQDLKITVSGDLACAHWLFRFAGMEPDHPAMQTWMRITSICQRNGDKWQIVHEHISVPFDPETAKAAFTLEP